jgi:hypothetical protein
VEEVYDRRRLVTLKGRKRGLEVGDLENEEVKR